MEQNKKVIFIGGSSYSGSTMLDMMVANSREGFSVGEVHALFRPYRAHHLHPLCGCEDPSCNFWHQISTCNENRLYKTIFSVLPEVNFIVDSSKHPLWIKQQAENLQKQNIGVYHLLIWKKPEAFAHSMLKRKRKRWHRAWKNYYRLYFSLIDDFLSIPYSALTKDPDKTLQDICKKTCLPYNEDRKNFWHKQHHTLFGNRSAKIHLSTKPQECNEHTLNINRQHQTIYHDETYYQEIPHSVINRIESDPIIQNILVSLNGKNGSSKIKKEEIRYSPLEMVITIWRWQMRRLMFRKTGKYCKIFKIHNNAAGRQ